MDRKLFVCLFISNFVCVCDGARRYLKCHQQTKHSGEAAKTIMKICHRHTILIFNLTFSQFNMNPSLPNVISSWYKTHTHTFSSFIIFVHSRCCQILCVFCASDVETIKGWTQIERTFLDPIQSNYATHSSICWHQTHDGTHGQNVTTSKSSNSAGCFGWDKFHFKYYLMVFSFASCRSNIDPTWMNKCLALFRCSSINVSIHPKIKCTHGFSRSFIDSFLSFRLWCSGSWESKKNWNIFRELKCNCVKSISRLRWTIQRSNEFLPNISVKCHSLKSNWRTTDCGFWCLMNIFKISFNFSMFLKWNTILMTQ